MGCFQRDILFSQVTTENKLQNWHTMTNQNGSCVHYSEQGDDGFTIRCWANKGMNSGVDLVTVTI